MAIPEGHKMNFDTMKKAFSAGDIALMECTEQATGEFVYVICAVEYNSKKDEYEFKPFARMFKDNPYEEWSPPLEKEGK